MSRQWFGMAAVLITAAATVSAAAAQVTPDLPRPAESGTADEDMLALGDDGSNRMTVPVSIGGRGPYQFVVDTGAERTVVSDELALLLDLNAAGTAEVHSISGTKMINTVSVPSLTVSETSVSDLTAPVLLKRNIGAAGMLGIDSLQTRRVVLDFKAQTMTVSPVAHGREAREPDEGDTIVVRARNRLGRLILADASIDGRNVAVVVDTGAEHSIGNAALRKRVLGRKKDAFVIPIDLFSVTGGKIAAEVTLIKSMRIGSLRLTAMPVAFADLPIFRQLGLDRKPAMLLGMNTLRAFEKVSVDFANRSVRFIIPGDSRRDDANALALGD